MSTGKRLAKRSIIGTRVCARGEDGFYYSGVINGVKTAGNSPIAPPSESRYTVRFDSPGKPGISSKREYRDVELVGPGFQTMHGISLLPEQKVYITYNGREISGKVMSHQQPPLDEVVVTVQPPGQEGSVEVRKRLEEVRLTECRKSARLQDQQDTDYSRLADMAGDRRRLSSHNIDVPQGSDVNNTTPQIFDSQRSRKRRPSASQDDPKEDLMDECTAALVLMHLSCSPHSPNGWKEPLSPALSVSDACSWRSNTPSPPLSEGVTNWFSASDEGIVLDDDFDELPKKKKAVSYHLANRLVYKCTWPKCNVRTTTCSSIEAHVRKMHLGPRNDRDEGMESDDREEEFYYTEVEVGVTSPPPTLSHRDMARPPHEDPEYQKAFGLSGHQIAGPMSIPNASYSWSMSSAFSPQMKLSVSAPSGKLPGSPSRRIRGDTKKCRKVYGMEHKEQWCTQCKWKKACTRFGD